MNPLVLRQPMILTFLFHKSATNGQIYSKSESSFKLKSLLLNILNTEKFHLWLLRNSHSNIGHFFGHLLLYVHNV